MGKILGEPPEGVWHFGKIWQKFVNKKFTKNFSKWLDFAEIRRMATIVAPLKCTCALKAEKPSIEGFKEREKEGVRKGGVHLGSRLHTRKQEPYIPR